MRQALCDTDPEVPPWHRHCYPSRAMNIPPGPKTTSSIVVLIAIFVALVLFAARFTDKDIDRELENNQTVSEQTVTADAAAPAEKTGSSERAKESKAPDASEPPPDRTVADLVKKWNQGNADEIAAFFASDGTLVIPTGSEIHSRAEIKQTISEKREGMLRETTLSNTVDRVSRPDPETAVVQGTYKLDGIKILGFNTSAAGTYKLHQVRQNGRWLISKAEVKKQDERS